MSKRDPEKIAFAEELMEQGVPYRQIQEKMKEKFGSGMSNNTLNKLQQQKSHIQVIEKELTQTKEELALFKKLYFELLAATKKRLREKAKNA